jgi:hypothetical protein
MAQCVNINGGYSCLNVCQNEVAGHGYEKCIQNFRRIPSVEDRLEISNDNIKIHLSRIEYRRNLAVGLNGGPF